MMASSALECSSLWAAGRSEGGISSIPENAYYLLYVHTLNLPAPTRFKVSCWSAIYRDIQPNLHVASIFPPVRPVVPFHPLHHLLWPFSHHTHILYDVHTHTPAESGTLWIKAEETRSHVAHDRKLRWGNLLSCLAAQFTTYSRHFDAGVPQ